MNTNEMKGVWIPFEILKDKNLNESEKMIYSLYWYYTTKGELKHCCLTNQTICNIFAYEERKLQRTKKHLKEMGYIKTDGGIKTTALKYTNFEEDKPISGGDKFDGEGVTNLTLWGDKNDTHNKEKNKKEINNITYNISTFIGGDKNDTPLNEGNENGTGFGSFLYGKETSTYIGSTEPETETKTLQVEESENTPNGKEQLLPSDEETTLQREEPNNTPTSTPTKEIKTPDGVILPTGTTTITPTAICYQDSLNEEKTKVREIKRDIDSGVFDNLHQLEQRLIFTPIVGGAYGEQLKRYFNYKCGSF